MKDVRLMKADIHAEKNNWSTKRTKNYRTTTTKEAVPQTYNYRILTKSQNKSTSFNYHAKIFFSEANVQNINVYEWIEHFSTTRRYLVYRHRMFYRVMTTE